MLVRENPAVTYYRSRLSMSRLYLGRLLADAGRTAEARAALHDSIAMASDLAGAHPDVDEFQSRLADGRRALGRLEARAGRLEEAEAELRAALTLCREQANASPEITAHRDCLAEAEGALSGVLRRRGRADEARDHADRAIDAHEALVRQDPLTTAYRAGLAEDLLNRALARRALDDPNNAASDLRRALALLDALPSRSGEDWFVTACCHAVLAGLEGSVGHAEAGIARLRQAIAAGFRDRDVYRHDALDPIRSRNDFRLLLMDLDMPAEPFAKPR